MNFEPDDPLNALEDELDVRSVSVIWVADELPDVDWDNCGSPYEAIALLEAGVLALRRKYPARVRGDEDDED